MGLMPPLGSQGSIYGKIIPCENSNFLSFWVIVSKCNELKSGADNKVEL